MERSTAPLKIADDAIIIDTDLTIEEVTVKCIGRLKRL